MWGLHEEQLRNNPIIWAKDKERGNPKLRGRDNRDGRDGGEGERFLRWNFICLKMMITAASERGKYYSQYLQFSYCAVNIYLKKCKLLNCRPTFHSLSLILCLAPSRCSIMNGLLT